MIKHKQLYRHNPEQNIWGDCGRTVIACLLERLPESVPHFWFKADPDAITKCRKWLKTQGYDYLLFPMKVDDISTILNVMQTQNKGHYYFLTGTSRNNVNHVVICQGDRIVHDPSLDNSGIIGPADDGYFWIELLVRSL